MNTPDRKTPPPTRQFSHLTIPGQSTVILPEGPVINTVRAGGNNPANRISIVWNYGLNRNGGSQATTMVPPMLLQGTETKSGEYLLDQMDFMGAFLNHTIHTGYTSMEVLSLNEFTGDVLELLGEILTQPSFPAERFEAMKRKSVANFELNHTRPKVLAGEKLIELVAGNDHPYALPITKERIQSITLNHVKQAWEQGLHNTAIQIFAAGYITDNLQSALIKLAQRLRPEKTENTYQPPVPYSPGTPGIYTVEMPDTLQSSVAIGIPAIDRTHPDYINLRIAVTALGGYFGSRLMSEVRERQGLTYGIQSVLLGSPEGGLINIQAECDNTYVPKVLEAIDKEIWKLSEHLMDAEEFNRLTSYYSTTVAAAVESFKSIGEYYENQLTVGLPRDYFEQQQLQLRTFTPDILRETVRKYILTDKAIKVIAGADLHL